MNRELKEIYLNFNNGLEIFRVGCFRITFSFIWVFLVLESSWHFCVNFSLVIVSLGIFALFLVLVMMDCWIFIDLIVLCVVFQVLRLRFSGIDFRIMYGKVVFFGSSRI